MEMLIVFIVAPIIAYYVVAKPYGEAKEAQRAEQE